MKRLVILSLFAILFCISSTGLIFGGNYSSVPLTSPIYALLDQAQITGAIQHVPSVKPYTESKVIELLNEMIHGTKLSAREKKIAESYLESFNPVGNVLQDGYLSFGDTPLTADMGIRVETLSSADFAGLESLAQTNYLNFFMDGDIGTSISYAFDMAFALNLLQIEAFPVYSYSTDWDGYTYSLSSMGGAGDIEQFYSLAFRSRPELSAGFFDDKVTMNFGRHRREWGLGSDSLVLSGAARPIVAFETTVQLTDWMSYTYLVGTLENGGDSTTASQLQTMTAMKIVEIRPLDWIYIAIHEGVVFPKRFELGYLNPLIFSSLYQGQIGDFDNIMGGATLGLSLPGWTEVWTTLYIDELQPNSIADFFNYVRNLYSFQAGVQAAIPSVPFGLLTLQYTKIEPFTYTHPLVEVPWIDPVGNIDRVYESFVSGGEGLSTKLDPNTDELLIRINTSPMEYFSLHGGYQLIRHGEFGGSYEDPLQGYSDDPETPENEMLSTDMEEVYEDAWGEPVPTNLADLRKAFLRDGDYEWYNIFSLGGNYDLLPLTNIPVNLSLTGSAVYQFKNDHTGARKSWENEGWHYYITAAINIW
ncbi:MAG: hypothetical protein HQ557_12990 [Bacteroidetes bacterium]|nr:hypothetical protein [Bacteroidota bacterium]